MLKMKATEPDALVYTVPETARLLGLSKSSAYDAIDKGNIPAIRIGGRIRVPKDALAKLLNLDLGRVP